MATNKRRPTVSLVGISPEAKILLERLTRVIPPSKGYAAPSQREVMDPVIYVS